MRRRYRLRVIDAWSDDGGCWADVWDDDHEEMQACEAIPDPGSALGLCAEHGAQIMAGTSQC